MKNSIYIPNRDHFNYYHFLMLNLSQMKNIHYIPDTIYVNLYKSYFGDRYNFIYDILHMIYPNSKIVDTNVCPYGCLSLDPNFVDDKGNDNPNLSECVFLNTIFEPYLKSYIPKKTYSDKIYISRADTKKRQILNEKELCSILESDGFETVSLTGLSVLEQIHIFKGARVIVGAHGANLTNTIFCEPGTKIIEINSLQRSRVALHYLCISISMNLVHRFFTDATEVFKDGNPEPHLIVNKPYSILNFV